MTISIFGREAGGASLGSALPGASRSPPSGSRPAPERRLAPPDVLNIAHARRKPQHQGLLRDTTIRRNLKLIAGVLERERPQIVALQEADGPSFWSGGFDHVAALAGLAGFPHAFRGEHNRELLTRLDLSYGTALLSQLPLAATHSQAFFDNWRDTKGFVTATVAPDALAGEAGRRGVDPPRLSRRSRAAAAGQSSSSSASATTTGTSWSWATSTAPGVNGGAVSTCCCTS
jgi:hypothetical protein